jgi:hypothetical protein
VHADLYLLPAQTTGKEGLPHVILEALSPNDLTLPRGAECDKCNHYFGRKLEPNLYRYPGVAFALQFLGHSRQEWAQEATQHHRAH